MFYSIAVCSLGNEYYTNNQQIKLKTKDGERKEIAFIKNSPRLFGAARGADAISGLVLLIVGALAAAGIVNGLHPVGCYALIGVGGIQASYFINRLLQFPVGCARQRCTAKKTVV